jgi:hypothetical protein
MYVCIHIHTYVIMYNLKASITHSAMHTCSAFFVDTHFRDYLVHAHDSRSRLANYQVSFASIPGLFCLYTRSLLTLV